MSAMDRSSDLMGGAGLHLLTPTHVGLSQHPRVVGREDGLVCRIPLDLRNVGAHRRHVEFVIVEFQAGDGPAQPLLWVREFGGWEEPGQRLIDRLEEWPPEDAAGPPADFPAWTPFPKFTSEADSRCVWIGEFHADAKVEPLRIGRYRLKILARLPEDGEREVLRVVDVQVSARALAAIARGVHAIPCTGVFEVDV
jgi:hypothetical protein